MSWLSKVGKSFEKVFKKLPGIQMARAATGYDARKDAANAAKDAADAQKAVLQNELDAQASATEKATAEATAQKEEYRAKKKKGVNLLGIDSDTRLGV